VDARQRRAVTAAAVVNAALIAVPPFVLALRSTLAEDNVVRPPGVSGLPPILTLPLVYILTSSPTHLDLEIISPATEPSEFPPRAPVLNVR